MSANTGNTHFQPVCDTPARLAPSIRLRRTLDQLYHRFNRPEYISPDPLQFLANYPDLADREIAGLVASSLAFGNVKQIIRSVSIVLAEMGRPRTWLVDSSERVVSATFRTFRHRYVTGADLGGMLCGVKRVIDRYGSLGACFAQNAGPCDDSVLPGLEKFVADLRNGFEGRNYLLPSPADGSACKRLNLYLRWMVRRDAVDPGGWDFVSPAQLIVPLDTHMHRMAKVLGLTSRRAADIRTALDVTNAFRRLIPHDPVRYDFALTRLGIRSDISAHDVFCRSGR